MLHSSGFLYLSANQKAPKDKPTNLLYLLYKESALHVRWFPTNYSPVRDGHGILTFFMLSCLAVDAIDMRGGILSYMLDLVSCFLIGSWLE